MEKVTWKRPFLVLWKVKVEEGRSVFRLAKFYYCSITIKVALVLIVFVSSLGYLKGLISGEISPTMNKLVGKDLNLSNLCTVWDTVAQWLRH